MRRDHRRTPGFTLIEVLVILAIIAVLAGVLIPSVANQVGKAEIGRTTSDLESLRTAIETFLVDVKRYPGDIEDLLVKPAAQSADDLDLNGNQYPTALANKWSGPYVDASDSTFETGFGGTVVSDLGKEALIAGQTDYLTVKITGIGAADFLKIAKEIDGANADSTTGRLRYSAIGNDTITYLAIPIN